MGGVASTHHAITHAQDRLIMKLHESKNWLPFIFLFRLFQTNGNSSRTTFHMLLSIFAFRCMLCSVTLTVFMRYFEFIIENINSTRWENLSNTSRLQCDLNMKKWFWSISLVFVETTQVVRWRRDFLVEETSIHQSAVDGLWLTEAFCEQMGSEKFEEVVADDERLLENSPYEPLRAWRCC